jgi:hypothetical protein
LLSYAAIAHTPGLRIRFVRFRLVVWGVEVIDTIARQYSGEAASRSNRSILQLTPGPVPPRLRGDLVPCPPFASVDFDGEL